MPPSKKVTVRDILAKKQNRIPITMLTAYDYPSARIVDSAGVDIILVGDSLGMVVLGYTTTLPVTMDDMIHHVKAVTRIKPRAFVVADMPYGSFHISPEGTVRNGIRFIQECGADAVKIEGGRERLHIIERLLEAEIPVMGHLGLTPQSYLKIGGFVRPKSDEECEKILADARALEQAGVFSLVLECIPSDWAKILQEELSIPTIGIGAGPHCDGQVLVFHDLVGLTPGTPPPFAPRLVNGYDLFLKACQDFVQAVSSNTFDQLIASEQQNQEKKGEPYGNYP